MKLQLTVALLTICCLVQTLGLHIGVSIPYETHGDLYMPGFIELNAALMSGELDLVPALSRLPPIRTDSLANVLKRFFTDLSADCRRRGEEEMAVSLDTLAGVAPEFAELSVLYGKVDTTWAAVFAMRDLGNSLMVLRGELETAVEVVETPLHLLTVQLLDMINNLGNEPSIVKIQIQAKKVAHDFEGVIASVVGDSAEMLRLGARLAADVLNHREAERVDIEDITKATYFMQTDFQEAVAQLQQQVSQLREALLRATADGLISLKEMADITLTASQINTLAAREAKDVTHATHDVMQSSFIVHRALIAFQT